MNYSWSDSVVYLIQGRLDIVKGLLQEMSLGPNVFVLTWDKKFPINDLPRNIKEVFFPNSTWAEGRNKILEEALSAFPKAEYFVFLDDDVRFERLSMYSFEKQLLKYRPKIAVPLCDRIIREMSYSRHSVERPIRHDQVMMAFHKSIFEEGIVLPIDTKFDKSSWWLTCEMNHYLIQKFYFQEILCFNEIVIRNSNHAHENSGALFSFDKSQYKSRFTAIQMDQVLSYIKEKHGSQDAMLDTIFQAEVLKRFRIVNLNRIHLENLFILIRKGEFSAGVS